MNLEEREEYVDTCLLTKEDLEEYDVEAITENIIKKIREFKKSRNRFLDGYHYRMTPKYEPRLEMFTVRKSDPVGKTVEYKFDSQEEYDDFNIRLEKLLALMSYDEAVYINDCLISSISESTVRGKLNLGKDSFKKIKNSALVRFAIAFNLVVYK